LEDSYKTSAVVTTIKTLETTRAVEDFLRFNTVNAYKGYGAGKLLASGSVLVVVPPIEVVHTDSKLAGSKVTITYGWVILTFKGTIVKAESMQEPAQGWDHVEKRVRDTAVRMLEGELDGPNELISASEALLLSRYGMMRTSCTRQGLRGRKMGHIASERLTERLKPLSPDIILKLFS
jgi:hypothetical protein